MKHSPRILLTLFAMALSMASYAYDVLVDGIYYDLNSMFHTATVTYNYRYSRDYSGTVNIPDSITSDGATYSVNRIGSYAFESCSGLTSVTLPNSVVVIEDDAFNDCHGLTSLTLSNSLTKIGSSAFAYCSSLTSLFLPNKVNTILDQAFYYCNGLESITVDPDNPWYQSPEGCNAIIDKFTKTLIVGCNKTFIPNSVTSIGKNAFCGCSGLTSLTFPNSLTSIGDNAFSGCSGLTS